MLNPARIPLVRLVGEGKIYRAEAINGQHGGLLVTRRADPRGGAMLPVVHKQFAEYMDGLETAIDREEFDSLCRAIYLRQSYQGAPNA